MDNEVKGIITIFIFGIFLGFLVGAFFGEENGIETMKENAVKAKAAIYETNIETGNPEFKWITECQK